MSQLETLRFANHPFGDFNVSFAVVLVSRMFGTN